MTNKLILNLCALALAGMLTAVAVPETLLAQQPQAETSAGGMVTLDFKDIDLKDLIQTISEMTGKNFLYDETVRGKVTIISPKKMSLDEAYNLFLTVLNVKGFTVVPSGKVNKIVPTKDAKESNLPTVSGQGRRGTEQFITRLIPLENVDAAEVATILAPLIPKTSSIVAYPPSNTLIVTDSAANIDRLLGIVGELDVALSTEKLEVIPLLHGNAGDIAKLATDVMTQRASSQPTRRRTARNVQAAGQADKDIIKVLAYDRTNSLVVVASEDDMLTIKDLVKKLDAQPTQERSFINVYYLENADAETLAKTMNEIVTGVKAQATKAPAARAQNAQAAQAAAALSSQEVSITFDKPTNSLIINALPEDYEILRKIIAQLDIKRKQVYVEALILELSMDATKRLGASLQGAVDVGNDSVIFGTSNLNGGPVGLDSLADSGDTGVPSLLGQAINGILLGGLFNPITVTGLDGKEVTVPALSALIDLSKTDADVSILSAPRLLTSDNEEAEILVGSNVPVITSRLTDTGSTGLAQSVSVERQDVALILRFTPQVTEGDLVRLNVYQETTDIARNSVGDVNEVGPTFTKRTIRNTVLAENGRTVVLGGLIGTNIQEAVSKVPLLGDIPLLGWLFTRKFHNENKTNLLIFITPRIVRDADDLARVTQRSRGVMEKFTTPEMRATPQMETLDDSMRLPVPPAGEGMQEKTGAQ